MNIDDKLSNCSELALAIRSVAKLSDIAISSNSIKLTTSKDYEIDLSDLQTIFMLINKISLEIYDEISNIEVKK